MSADLEAWLAARRPAPPPALARRMAAALAPGEDGPAPALPEALAGAALALLARVTAAAGTAPAAVGRRPGAASEADLRETALDLLAADALLTYAFEAAAEEGPARAEALAERFGPSPLAALLPAGSGG